MSATTYFVDEAGDTTLFGRYGKPLTNTEGVSKFFMVGRLEVGNLAALQADLDALRAELLADPLLQSIPSMQAKAAKTALFFHAKDDVPEVRHAVFKLLLKHDLRLSVVIKEKERLASAVIKHQASHPSYRYNANGHDVYDWLIGKLFLRSDWMLGASPHITFAVRGNKARTAALKDVFEKTVAAAFKVLGSNTADHASLQSTYPSQSAGLQACDYLLWALQRFYERGEERHLQAMWPKFERVLDLDYQDGTTFNEKHPLNLTSRAGV
ncbi:MAG: hypothetical protein RLY95_1667 [Pseudomonadota bacterium]|jgi:hypothetical protein